MTLVYSLKTKEQFREMRRGVKVRMQFHKQRKYVEVDSTIEKLSQAYTNVTKLLPRELAIDFVNKKIHEIGFNYHYPYDANVYKIADELSNIICKLNYKAMKKVA